MSKKTREEDPVARPNRYWHEMIPIWKMTRALWGGTRAMRAARELYLPQEPAEPETAYVGRLRRSVLTPYYPDILKKLIGKILKQPVVANDDVPTAIARYLDDVDAQGSDLNEWARKIGTAAMDNGVTYILVDYPSTEDTEEEVTRAEELDGTVRPYGVHVLAEQILGWKSEIVQGQERLTQVRILIKSEEDSTEDEFTQVVVERIQVWEIGLLRIYRKNVTEDGQVSWDLETVRTITLDHIPLIAVYSDQKDFMKASPPLEDVAHLNVTHWQSDSDQRHILHVARVPILFGSGLGDEERGDFQLQVGPNTMTRGPQGSDLKYVEHSGKGIDSGANDLEDLTARMAKLGLNMIIRRQPGDVTATARTLDQSESDSPLGLFARQLESKLEAMLDIFGEWMGMGKDAGGTVSVYKDFSITLRDGEDIKALADMRVRGDISQLTYWAELKRRNLLSDDFDSDEEIDLLDLEYQDSQAGLTEAEANAGNRAGDETEAAEGHTHVLQANGFTNIVDGHSHKWEPTGDTTAEANGHFHGLRGIPDGQTNSRQGQAQAAGPGVQVNQPAGGQ